MHSTSQLLRRKGKTLAGILLFAMAVAVLGVCVGQCVATQQTWQQLDYEFTTIGLATTNYNRKLMSNGVLASLPTMNTEVAQWIDQVVQEHPELVEGWSNPSLASAWIPGLTANHYQTENFQEYYGRDSFGYINDNTDRLLPHTPKAAFVTNQDVAMLVITLDSVEVLEPNYLPMSLNRIDPATGEKEKVQRLESYEVKLQGRIDNVLALSPEHDDPTNWPIVLRLTVPASQKVEDFRLEAGKQYVVYGLDYYNNQNYLLSLDGIASPQLQEKYKYITMSLQDFAADMEFSYEDGSVVYTRTYTRGGETVTVSLEDYLELFSIPTIAPLEGEVEEFLRINPLWQEYLEYAEMNLETYAVIGVQKLDHLADFARELTRVTQGREFTREEMETGAKVCLISETLAHRNGLQVGDTVTPRFYDPGAYAPYDFRLDRGDGTVLPKPHYFTSNSQLLEAEEYTVVGLYRQSQLWEDAFGNPYSFTPNTVFVPQKSLTAPTELGEQGLFKTLVLHNGSLEAFDALVMDKTFQTVALDPEIHQTDLFVYYDQGYRTVAQSLNSYEKLANRVLAAGSVAYCVILVLFLLLYPLQMRKTLWTMASLGAPRRDRLSHMLVSCLGVLIPGTVLGTAIALALWGPVVGSMLQRRNASFTLGMDLGTMGIIGFAQLLAATVLVLLLAIPMTKHKNLMKRK